MINWRGKEEDKVKDILVLRIRTLIVIILGIKFFETLILIRNLILLGRIGIVL